MYLVHRYKRSNKFCSCGAIPYVCIYAFANKLYHKANTEKRLIVHLKWTMSLENCADSAEVYFY